MIDYPGVCGPHCGIITVGLTVQHEGHCLGCHEGKCKIKENKVYHTARIEREEERTGEAKARESSN